MSDPGVHQLVFDFSQVARIPPVANQEGGGWNRCSVDAIMCSTWSLGATGVYVLCAECCRLVLVVMSMSPPRRSVEPLGQTMVILVGLQHRHPLRKFSSRCRLLVGQRSCAPARLQAHRHTSVQTNVKIHDFGNQSQFYGF